MLGMRTDRSLLYILYWAINLILALTNVDLTSIKEVRQYLFDSELGVYY